MKKVIVYLDESAEPNQSALYLDKAKLSPCWFLPKESLPGLNYLEDAEPTKQELNTMPLITEELIMLKKAGFTAQEIIELKQSKLI